MIANQFKASFEKLGIREVGQVGEPFDPALHNAVAHIESDELGEKRHFGGVPEGLHAGR